MGPRDPSHHLSAYPVRLLAPETDALAEPVPADEVPNHVPTQAIGK